MVLSGFLTAVAASGGGDSGGDDGKRFPSFDQPQSAPLKPCAEHR